MMKQIAKFILLIVIVLCCSCRNSHKTNNYQGESSNINYETDYHYSGGTPSSTIPAQSVDNVSSSITETTIDRYDEGLLDGEATAEEDKLAGKPGMQIGDDDGDDDEEYEDGYDDGYDD